MAFCSNLTKVDSLENFVISYDFKDILMLRELRDFDQVNPQVKWGPPKFYLLKDFAKISLHIVLEHQVDTNMFVPNMISKFSIGSMLWYST